MSKAARQHRSYPPAYMTAAEVAFWLNCAERTIEHYSKVKLLPSPVLIGNLVRWRWTDVEAHIAEQNGEAVGPANDGTGGDEYSDDLTRLRKAKEKADGRAA